MSPDDLTQQWILEKYNRNMVIRNYATKACLDGGVQSGDLLSLAKR